MNALLSFVQSSLGRVKMRSLGLDASTVPIVYRLRVTSPDGQRLAETTVMLCESEIERTLALVRVEYAGAGMPDVAVEAWPA